MKYWQRELCTGAIRGDIARMQEALDNGADINLKAHPRSDVNDLWGHPSRSALQHACAVANLGAARYLIEQGAVIDMFDPVGQTPLVLACRMRDVDTVRMLLEWGANDQGYSQGGQRPANSPLSCACSDGYLDLVRVLVERGLDPFKSNDEKRPPVWDAFFWSKWEVARYLVDIASSRGQEALDATLVLACRFSGCDFQSLIIDCGADVNGFDPFDGVTPLVAAATWGSPEIVSLLLERGGDPYFVNGESGVTVLDCVLRISGKNESHARSALILAQAMGLTPLSNVNGKTLLTSFSNASAKQAIRDAQRVYRAKLMSESIDEAMGGKGGLPAAKRSSSGLSL